MRLLQHFSVLVFWARHARNGLVAGDLICVQTASVTRFTAILHCLQEKPYDSRLLSQGYDNAVVLRVDLRAK